MPNVEVDEVELANLRRLSGVAAKITAHPEGKKLLEKAHKLVDPNAITPALDQEKIIQEPIEKALARVGELEKKLSERDAELEKEKKLAGLNATVDKGFERLRQEGWQAEGIEGVKKVMEEKGILDPLDAAAIFEKQHPPPPPATPSGHGSWGFMEAVADGEKDLQALIASKGESNSTIDKMAREALADVRGQSPRR